MLWLGVAWRPMVELCHVDDVYLEMRVLISPVQEEGRNLDDFPSCGSSKTASTGPGISMLQT